MLKPLQGRTMCAEMVGEVLLVVHGPAEPASEEWSAYCDYASGQRALHGGQLRTLVVTASDAGPSARQRSEYRDKVAGEGNRIAVLCAGNVTRAILTAMSWFNKEMKPFGVGEFEAACEYLEVSWSRDLEMRLHRLREQLTTARRQQAG